MEGDSTFRVSSYAFYIFSTCMCYLFKSQIIFHIIKILKENPTNDCYGGSEPWRVLEDFFFYCPKNNYQHMLLVYVCVMCTCVYLCMWVCVNMIIFLNRIRYDWLKVLLTHILKKLCFIQRVE